MELIKYYNDALTSLKNRKDLQFLDSNFGRKSKWIYKKITKISINNETGKLGLMVHEWQNRFGFDDDFIGIDIDFTKYSKTEEGTDYVPKINQSEWDKFINEFKKFWLKSGFESCLHINNRQELLVIKMDFKDEVEFENYINSFTTNSAPAKITIKNDIID